MGYPTPIEWTDATWNPIGGCSIKSPGCAPCYAQKLAGTRLKTHPLYAGTTDLVKGKPVFNGHLTAAPDDHPVWRWPLSWRGAKAPKLGTGSPSLIFVGDMSDLYHEDRASEVQDRAVASIVHSRHIGQLLTKRPDEMASHIFSLYYNDRWRLLPHPLFGTPNFADNATWAAVTARLWLGMSAERQKEFDERWPYLRELAGIGFVVFVSYEPAIGPLKLPADFLALGPRAQVISGGMSGDDATAAHPGWFRNARDQCLSAGVAYFHKQNGEWAPCKRGTEATPHAGYCHPEGRTAKWPKPEGFGEHGPHWLEAHGFAHVARVGKKAAGRLLDGREHNGFPDLTRARQAA